MATRIYALASELRVDSKELAEAIVKFGIKSGMSALSTLSDDEAARVRELLPQKVTRAAEIRRRESVEAAAHRRRRNERGRQRFDELREFLNQYPHDVRAIEWAASQNHADARLLMHRVEFVQKARREQIGEEVVGYPRFTREEFFVAWYPAAINYIATQMIDCGMSYCRRATTGTYYFYFSDADYVRVGDHGGNPDRGCGMVEQLVLRKIVSPEKIDAWLDRVREKLSDTSEEKRWSPPEITSGSATDQVCLSTGSIT